MRAAMAEAEVGDDVYGEDPTVNRLEARAAEIFGREAALFVPTGTMGNQIAIRMHTEHGQEVICESRGHLVDWEMAMVSAFSGCQLRTVYADRGTLTWPAIKNVISGAANLVAASVFAAYAPVEWAFVPPLAAGFLVGGYAGQRLARHLPVAVLRAVVALAGLALAVKLGIAAYR